MTIAEISKKYDIPTDTLRYYERIGLLPPVKRNESGYRDYDQEDEEWIFFVKAMRGAGISVESLIEYISLFQNGIDTIPARKQILIDQRDLLANRIADMQEVLERLNHKIEGYEDRLLKYEGKLYKK